MPGLAPAQRAWPAHPRGYAYGYAAILCEAGSDNHHQGDQCQQNESFHFLLLRV